MSSTSWRVARVVPCLAALVFALVIALALVAAPLSEAKGGDGGGGSPPAHAQNDGGGGNGGATSPAAAEDRREAEAPAAKPAQAPEQPAAKPDKPAEKPDEPAAKPDKPAGSGNGATHVEKPAGAGNPGAIQGNSPSDPDGNTNGGADKPGYGGGFTDDKDGNNGCGNDDDREDDNNGNCGGKPAKPSKDRPATGDRPDGTPSSGDKPAGGKPAKGGKQDVDTPDRGNACPLAVKMLQKALKLLGVDADLDCDGSAGGAKSQAPGQANGPAGKVTICHATGSATNPFVQITISRNGLNGHGDHGGDIIPAPAGGCPALTTPDTPDDGQARPQAGKVTICHATGSATNPFVEITISENGLNGHARHEGDIIPMPAGGCPVPVGTPDTPDDDNPGSAQGKVTICHATGSATNPFVEITISENGLNGHARHEGDIIPAPATGCPALTSPNDGTPNTPQPGTITICHATGSATNPFVTITISVNGLNGHGKHQGDIIPMPAGGCPVPTTPTTPDGGTPTTGTTPPGGAAGGGAGASGGGEAQGTPGDADAGGEAVDGAAAGNPTATAEGADGAEGADEADTTAVDAADGESALPFTGLALGTLALLALAALGAGWFSHRHGKDKQLKRDGAR